MAINFVALIVAALIPIVLGFVWYHPKVFGTAWMNATGMTEEKARAANMPLLFGLSFLFSMMLAFIMNLIAYHDAFVEGSLFYVTNGTMIPEAGSADAQWLEHFKTNYSAACRTFKHGSFHGTFIAGIMIALPIIGTNALYEGRGFKYIAITAGFWILSLGLMGGTIAAWK